jgi:mono/diheme cytochrome c family protein
MLFAGGCKNEPANEAPKPASTAATQRTLSPATPAIPEPASGSAEARKIFKSRCIVCHGESGTGNGPGAAALNPKPRNYTDSAWQKSATDDEIRNAILLGGAAVGKSSGMPPNPDLRDKPEVLDGLVKIVRSFANSD